MHHYRRDPTQVDSLNNDRITALYRDRAGLLWIGTDEAGLNVYDPRQARFAHYRHNSDAPTSLAQGTVSAIYAIDKSRLWLGIGGALDYVNLYTGEVTHYSPEPQEGLAGRINAVHQDRAGVVWLGTSGFRVYRLDPATGQISRYPLATALSRPTPPKSVIAFHEDREGALWIVVDHDGLYRLDLSREKVQFYEGPPAVVQLAGLGNASGDRSPAADQ
jgi:ligand-binding sensor domain-containing protein